MTPKLSSCYKRNSLNAAVLTQQQPLQSGGAHSQTQAGNTNASPPLRARSKVHVTLGMLVPSLASALHKTDRTLPARQGRAQRPAPLARGPETVTAFQQRAWAAVLLWLEREDGWVGTQRPFWLIFTVCGLFICFPFPGSCHINFCSDSSGLNLVQIVFSGNLQVLCHPAHTQCPGREQSCLIASSWLQKYPWFH